MKQGTLITRIVIIVLFAAVLAYLGVSVWQGMSDPYRLVVSYEYQMNDSIAMDGFVVRQEETIPGASALAEVLPQEGEKVAAGAAVAAVYSSQEALDNSRQAQNLELELEQLSYAMRRNDNLGDGAALDQELVGSLALIRSGVSQGSLTDLEENGLNLRSLVLKRSSDLASGSEGVATLQAAAQDVEGRLKILRSSLAHQVQYITVSKSGVFSGMVDGFETILTPGSLDDLTVAQFRQLSTRTPQPPQNAVGKLITSSTWYYTAAIDLEAASRLQEGRKYTLDFTGDFRQQVPMTLVRLGEAEDGARLAVFSSDRYLSEATLARWQSAELVFQRFTGVWAPKKALRVLEQEDGASTLGVYVLVGRRAEFKPVEIVREGDGFYLLRGTATNRKVLRPGDVIILSNQELYDGKVVS